MNAQEEKQLRTYLDNTDRSKLTDLLVSACQSSKRIYGEVLRAMKRVHGTAFEALRNTAESIILSEQHSRSDYMSSYNEDALCYALGQIRELAAQTAEDPDAASEAIDMLAYVVQAVCRIDDRPDEGWMLATEANDAIEQMGKVVGSAAPEDRDALVHHVLEAADAPETSSGILGIDYPLAMIKALAPIADDNNRGDLLDAIDRLPAKVQYPASREADAAKQAVLSYASPAVAESYLAKHLGSDVLRNDMVGRAIDAKDFERAEQLCRDRIQQYLDDESGDVRGKRGEMSLHEWRARLRDVYAASGNTPGLTDVVRDLVREGDTDYFDEAKQLLSQAGTWSEERDRILRDLADKATGWKYAEVLEKEDEADKLLDLARNNSAVAGHHGVYLYQKRPEEFLELATAEIRREAAAATNRARYRNVGRHLADLASTGARHEALELLQEIKTENERRRPAFVDELEQAEERIHSMY